MKEVSTQQGKTVLFVSHNMQALKNLCDRGITLHEGKIIDEGNPEVVISNYLKKQQSDFLHQSYKTPESAPGNDYIRIKKVELVADYINDLEAIDIRTPLHLHFEFWYKDEAPGDLIIGVHLFNIAGDCIFDICSDAQKI